jgi:hypothetical protein
MKAEIKSIQERYKRDNKWAGRTRLSLIYTESHAYKDEVGDAVLKKYNPERIVDQWFRDNNISGLTKRSKAWSRAKRLANKYIYKTLKELVPCKSILYSRTAGCTCGCSPGFFVTEPELEEHKGVSAWAYNITLTDEERDEFHNALAALEPLVAEEFAQQALDEAELVTA